MAITVTNEVWNHRGVTYQYTGDGVTTASTVSIRKFNKPNTTCQSFGVINPTSFDRPSNRGGLMHPAGTAVSVASCSISNGNCTTTTSAAVANGTVAYITVILDQYGD